MLFLLAPADDEFQKWLAQTPSEDELREAYLVLETHRANLWQTGHIDSFHRDRYERDSRYVTRLVQLKWELANRWTTTGQFDRFAGEPQFA